MELTDRVHLLFRGASEFAKFLKFIAFCGDSLIAAIALYTMFAKPKGLGVWIPMIILFITIISVVLRAYSSTAFGYAQRCRRISLRAYCAGDDVDSHTVTLIDDDAPCFISWATRGLTAKSINEYYEPTTTPGTLRQAELYAHSAFYTWRLLRIQSWVAFILAAVVMIGCVILVYDLAANPTIQADRQAVLEAICTIVFLNFGVRGFEAWWSAYSSYRELRSIETELLKRPKGALLKDLVDSYDIERAAGASPATFLYNQFKDSLSQKWIERRRVFSAQSQNN